MKVRKKVRKKVCDQSPRIFSPMNLDTSFLPTMLSIGRETIILQQMIEGIDRTLNISQFCSIISKFETKFMTRKKIIFYRFIYFTKSCGKIPTAKPFISTVKAGHKLATPPYILITKGKNSVTNSTVLVAISSPDLP